MKIITPFCGMKFFYASAIVDRETLADSTIESGSGCRLYYSIGDDIELISDKQNFFSSIDGKALLGQIANKFNVIHLHWIKADYKITVPWGISEGEFGCHGRSEWIINVEKFISANNKIPYVKKYNNGLSFCLYSDYFFNNGNLDGVGVFIRDKMLEKINGVYSKTRKTVLDAIEAVELGEYGITLCADSLTYEEKENRE